MRVTRRKGAESAIDLRKIRRWFADGQDGGTGETDKPADDKQGDDGGADKELEALIALIKSDPKKAAGTIKELRAEAETNRKKAQAADKAQKDAAKAKADADAKKLADEKDFEKLAAQHKTEAETSKQELMKERRIRVALEAGLPKEMASRLQGESEDELLADAQSLAKMIVKDDGKGKKPGSTTTANPSGKPSGESHEQRWNRINGRGNPNIFGGRK